MTTLSRIDKIAETIPPPASIAMGAPISGVQVALLPVRTGPTAATVWATPPFANGQATVTYAGAEADSSGATLVVTGDADLWMLALGAPYQQAVKVKRITLQGGSGSMTPPPVSPVLSVQGRTGAVVLSASDVGADASGAAASAAAAAQTAAQTFATNAVATQATADRAAYVAGNVYNSDGSHNTTKTLHVVLTADGTDIQDLIIQ